MMLGSVAISSWGGPRRRVVGVVGAIALASVGIVTMGLRPSGALVGAGMGLFLFCIPIASGCSQAIFQSKVAPGRTGPRLCRSEHDRAVHLADRLSFSGRSLADKVLSD